MLWASQIAVGNENALSLRVYGEKGGLEWHHARVDELWFTPYGELKRLITRAGAGAGISANRVSRVPSGHPEGYLEGFATLYREAADAIIAARDGSPCDEAVIYPGIREGIAGLAFIEAAIQSSRSGEWVSLDL